MIECCVCCIFEFSREFEVSLNWVQGMSKKFSKILLMVFCVFVND